MAVGWMTSSDVPGSPRGRGKSRGPPPGDIDEFPDELGVVHAAEGSPASRDMSRVTSPADDADIGDEQADKGVRASREEAWRMPSGVHAGVLGGASL